MVEALQIERDRQTVLAALSERGGGSALRGWRKELDPDGSLDTNFLDFCKASSRMKIQVDALGLFGEDSPHSLTLHKLSPEGGALVNRFRKWMTEQYGGPTEMFMCFEPPDSDGGLLPRDVFKEKCIENGFEASDKDLSEIFNLLDAHCIGSIAMEDVSFLDMDEKRREGAIQKARTKRKFAHEHLLTEVYRENRKLTFPIAHRLAPRGWHAPAFDQLPEVIIEKRLNWQRLHDQRCKEAEAAFTKFLHSTYGNGVRAWRRGLDPGCKFVLRKVDLGRYCRVVNFNCDLACLWKTLDRDSDGHVCLEDVASRAAASLASFWYWVQKNHGGCALVWETIMKEARCPATWKSSSSLPYGSFLKALKYMGWKGIDQGIGTALCNALDLYGCGIVCRTDLQWLDRWHAPDWLCQEADPQAWNDFRKTMIHAYGPPLRQWRSMDKDNSNEVSWVEFQEACDDIGFHGNRGGVWRHLDKGLNGHIRLQDYDPAGARILLSFKDFVDKHFGSVEYAFKSMDTDGSGSLTFAEMRRACRRMKWKGDVRLLFICLDLDASVGLGARTLSHNELDFLDTWPVVDSQLPQADEGEDSMLTEEASSMNQHRLSVCSYVSSDAGDLRPSPPAPIPAAPSSPATALQRSASAPLRPASSSRGATLPPVRRRIADFQPGEHDPSWRKSRSLVKADILSAFRKQNATLRDKAVQLRSEYKDLQKQTQRNQRVRISRRPAEQEEAAEEGHELEDVSEVASEAGADDLEGTFRPGAVVGAAA